MALPSLPNEILLDIFEYLPVEDLFNLDTTCKALRTACSSDALWRSASANVSLDIPLGKDLSNMKAGELRKSHSKAAKVEKVWKGNTFSLTHVFEVPVRDWVHHTQFLSSEILLTSVPIEEDGERKTVLDIWSLANRKPVLELQIVTDRLFPKGIAAAWRKYGEELMLTVLTDQSDIRVHAVRRCRVTEKWTSVEMWRPMQLVRSVLEPRSVFEIFAMKHIVATFARTEDRVWFFNTTTKEAFYTQLPQYVRSESPALTLGHDLAYFALTTAQYTSHDPRLAYCIQAFTIPTEVYETQMLTSPRQMLFETAIFAHVTSPGFSLQSLSQRLLPYQVILDASHNLYIYEAHASKARVFLATFSIGPTEITLSSSQSITPPVSNHAYPISGRTWNSVGVLTENVGPFQKVYKFSHLVNGGALVRFPAERISSHPGHAIHILAYNDTAGRICLCSTGGDGGIMSKRLLVVDTI